MRAKGPEVPDDQMSAFPGWAEAPATAGRGRAVAISVEGRQPFQGSVADVEGGSQAAYRLAAAALPSLAT